MSLDDSPGCFTMIFAPIIFCVVYSLLWGWVMDLFDFKGYEFSYYFMLVLGFVVVLGLFWGIAKLLDD